MNKQPKTLVFDLETSYLVGKTWGPKWEANIIEFTEYSQVIGFSAKWIGGKQTSKVLSDYRGYKKGVINDKAIVTELHALVNEADILVGHNVKSFDIKVMNSRFIYHGLTPVSPYKVIDTKTEFKKYVRIPSYSLDDIGAYFGLGRKLKHEGFELWNKCIAGVASAWADMKKYNKQDVILTTAIYLLILPWISTGVWNRIYVGADGKCPKPNCGSTHLQKRGWVYVSEFKQRKRYQCQTCHSWPFGELEDRT